MKGMLVEVMTVSTERTVFFTTITAADEVINQLCLLEGWTALYIVTYLNLTWLFLQWRAGQYCMLYICVPDMFVLYCTGELDSKHYIQYIFLLPDLYVYVRHICTSYLDWLEVSTPLLMDI